MFNYSFYSSYDFFLLEWPNKSLEATRVGHRSSATRFTVIGRGCLSFFR
jgi:hypothetical protein